MAVTVHLPGTAGSGPKRQLRCSAATGSVCFKWNKEELGARFGFQTLKLQIMRDARDSTRGFAGLADLLTEFFLRLVDDDTMGLDWTGSGILCITSAPTKSLIIWKSRKKNIIIVRFSQALRAAWNIISYPITHIGQRVKEGHSQ